MARQLSNLRACPQEWRSGVASDEPGSARHVYRRSAGSGYVILAAILDKYRKEFSLESAFTHLRVKREKPGTKQGLPGRRFGYVATLKSKVVKGRGSHQPGSQHNSLITHHNSSQLRPPCGTLITHEDLPVAATRALEANRSTRRCWPSTQKVTVFGTPSSTRGAIFRSPSRSIIWPRPPA